MNNKIITSNNLDTNIIINKIKQIDSNNLFELNKLYNDLLKNGINRDKLNYLFYELQKYEYKSDNDDDTLDITDNIEQKIKRKDKKFKKYVKEYYKKCIITGRSNIVCEVAHIYPFCMSNIKDKYNKYNGILLCRDLHFLFDKKLLKINPDDFRLILNDEIINDKLMIDYHKYNNKILQINSKSKKYFKMLYEQ